MDSFWKTAAVNDLVPELFACATIEGDDRLGFLHLIGRLYRDDVANHGGGRVPAPRNRRLPCDVLVGRPFCGSLLGIRSVAVTLWTAPPWPITSCWLEGRNLIGGGQLRLYPEQSSEQDQ